MKRNTKRIIGALVASGAVIGATCIINKMIFYYSTMKKVLSSENSCLYQWRFGNIYYVKKGQGKPVLLVHDLKSWASNYEWTAVIDKLAETHTVYAIDLLGCGHSDKPKMTYTNYLYVQLLNDFVKEVIKGKTDVVTSASSSALGIMACHMEPDLYHKIMMINPDSPAQTAKVPKAYHKLFKYIIELPVIGTLIYNLKNAFFTIKKTFIKNYFNNSELVNNEYINAYHEAAHIGGADSRYLYASIKGRYTNIPVTKTIRDDNHSIIIVGGGEIEGIREVISVYTELNPAIEDVIVDDAKYLPQMEVPEKMEEIFDIYL